MTSADILLWWPLKVENEGRTEGRVLKNAWRGRAENRFLGANEGLRLNFAVFVMFVYFVDR